VGYALGNSSPLRTVAETVPLTEQPTWSSLSIDFQRFRGRLDDMQGILHRFNLPQPYVVVKRGELTYVTELSDAERADVALLLLHNDMFAH
jgi:hypothetical protein